MYIWGKNSHVINPNLPGNYATYKPTVLNGKHRTDVIEGGDECGRENLPAVVPASKNDTPRAPVFTDYPDDGPFVPVQHMSCGAWHIVTQDGESLQPGAL